MSPLGNLAYRKRVFFMQRKSYILYHPFLLLSKPIDHMMTKLNESTLRARNWLVTDWPTPLSNCPTTYARADFCPFLDQCFDTFQITGMFAINLVDGLLKPWQRYLSNMVDTVLSPVSFLPPRKKENKSNLPSLVFLQSAQSKTYCCLLVHSSHEQVQTILI